MTFVSHHKSIIRPEAVEAIKKTALEKGIGTGDTIKVTGRIEMPANDSTKELVAYSATASCDSKGDIKLPHLSAPCLERFYSQATVSIDTAGWMVQAAYGKMLKGQGLPTLA